MKNKTFEKMFDVVFTLKLNKLSSLFKIYLHQTDKERLINWKQKITHCRYYRKAQDSMDVS